MGWMACIRAHAENGLAIDELRGSARPAGGAQRRMYRVDVSIVPLGIPIFSRQGVGHATAALHESTRDGYKTSALYFAGGSDPKRTHGLNYSGATEEIALECGQELSAAASFGFVTASPAEESLEEARQRVMNAHSGGSFVVVDELHRAARVRIRKAFVPAPEAQPGFGTLTRDVRSQFSAARLSERELETPPPSVPATFLYRMLQASRSGERTFISTYFHNGKFYQLECEKTPDARGATRLSGRIRDVAARHTSTFRLWLEEGSDLPVRIEFAPRSYLRLSLQFDPEMTVDSEEEI